MRIILCLFPFMLTFCLKTVQGGGGGLEDMKQMEHALPYESSKNSTHDDKRKGTGRTHSGTKQKSSYQASGSVSNSSAYSTAKGSGTGSSGYYYYMGTGDSYYNYGRTNGSDSRRKSGDRRRSGDGRKSGRRSGSRQSGDYDSKWFGGRTSQYSRYSEMQTSDKRTRTMWKIAIKPEEFFALLKVIGDFLVEKQLGVNRPYTEKELSDSMQASGQQSFIQMLEPSSTNASIKQAIIQAFRAISGGGDQQVEYDKIEGIKSMLSCWTLALLVINCMSAVDSQISNQLSRMTSQRSMMPSHMSGMPSQIPIQSVSPEIIRDKLIIAKKRSEEIDQLIRDKKNVAAISDAQVIIINILNDKIGDNFITNTCTEHVTMKEGRATSRYYSGGASTYSQSDSRRSSGNRNRRDSGDNKNTGGGIIDTVASVFGRQSSREIGRSRSSSKVREGSGSYRYSSGRDKSSKYSRRSSRNDRERDIRKSGGKSKTNTTSTKTSGGNSTKKSGGGGERSTRKSGGGERGTRTSRSGKYSSSYGYSSSYNTRKSDSGESKSKKSGGRRTHGHGH